MSSSFGECRSAVESTEKKDEEPLTKVSGEEDLTELKNRGRGREEKMAVGAQTRTTKSNFKTGREGETDPSRVRHEDQEKRKA